MIRVEDAEEKPAFAIVLFDSNRLKRINDEHGHDRGDMYLKEQCKAICRVYAADSFEPFCFRGV